MTDEPPEHERRGRPRRSRRVLVGSGRARLRPEAARHYPSLRPDGWYVLLERNPEAADPLPPNGYVWIEVDGRPRRVWAAHLDIMA